MKERRNNEQEVLMKSPKYDQCTFTDYYKVDNKTHSRK